MPHKDPLDMSNDQEQTRQVGIIQITRDFYELLDGIVEQGTVPLTEEEVDDIVDWLNGPEEKNEQKSSM